MELQRRSKEGQSDEGSETNRGSNPYKEVACRTIYPAMIIRFLGPTCRITPEDIGREIRRLLGITLARLTAEDPIVSFVKSQPATDDHFTE